MYAKGQPQIPCISLAILTLSALITPVSLHGLGFEPRMDVSVGTAPLGISMADLDGDGRKDLIVAVHEEDKVVIYRGTGIPGVVSFDPVRWDFPTGLHPQGLVTADLDGDGKPEVVTANSGRGGGGSLSVFLNASAPGTISLVNRQDHPVDTAHRVAAGDLDGDGKLDLAVSANSPRQIPVFRNMSSPGTLSFSRALTLATVDYPNSVAIADMDGDGRPEILATVANVLSIYLNGSSLSTMAFPSRSDFTAADMASGFAVSDFGGDTKLDVAVANGFLEKLSVFINESIPGSLSLTRHDFPCGDFPREPTAADFDLDGRPDVVVTYETGDLAVFRNTLTPSGLFFERVVNLAAGPGQLLPFSGDLDGDASPDIAVSNNQDTTASVFRNTGMRATPTGISWKGTWDSGTNYALGDAVSFNGSSYISLTGNNTGNPPDTSPDYWDLLAQRGDSGSTGATGAQGPIGPSGPAGPQGQEGPQGPTGPKGINWRGTWSGSSTYATTDAVTFNGSSYISLTDGNAGNPPDTSPEGWELLARQGEPGATGVTGAQGPVGPQGPMGPQGPEGPQGPPGPAGADGMSGSAIGGNYPNTPNNTFLMPWGVTTSAIEANVNVPLPSGTAGKLVVSLTAAPGTGSATITIRKNGLNTTLSCRVSGSTTCSNNCRQRDVQRRRLAVHPLH